MAHPSRTLRSTLYTGFGSLVVALVVVFVTLRWQRAGATQHRRESRERYVQLDSNVQAQLIALLNQEVGLRGFLGTGDPRFLEPYHAGQAEEREATRGIEALLVGDDRAALGPPWRAMRDAADAWHRNLAEPQIAQRLAGGLPDLPEALRAGKRDFDGIRVAHDVLQEQVRARAVADALERERSVERADLIALLASLCVLALVAMRMRAVVRDTTEPLQKLVTAARAGGAFAPATDPDDMAVEEVHALARALGTLTTQVRERERLLEAEHGEAVSLGRFGEFVQQLTDEAELHRATARALEGKLGPKRLQVLVRNASHNRLDVAWPHDGAPAERAEFPILDDPMRCRAVRMGKHVVEEATGPTACECRLGVPASGSYLCVPMHAAGEVVGLVNLQSDEPARWTEDLRALGQGYINLASSGLSTIRLLSAARERALRDSLTGAYNRAFLGEYLGKQLSLAARNARPLSLLVLDLDHFKRLNDTYGHPFGDRALVTFAACLHQQVRAGDAVVRYGGEEFVVVLVDTSSELALEIAERIRRAVEHLVVTDGNHAPGSILRASIGCGTFPQHGTDDRSLIAAADRALYAAKQQGRNRVVVADAGGPG